MLDSASVSGDVKQGNVDAGKLPSPTCDLAIISYVLSDVPSLHPFRDGLAGSSKSSQRRVSELRQKPNLVRCFPSRRGGVFFTFESQLT